MQRTDQSQVQGAGGVVWSASPDGLHTNLVVLDAGHQELRYLTVHAQRGPMTIGSGPGSDV